MTRSLAAVLVLLAAAAAPIRVSAAPVTWSWEGVVRTATGTFSPDGFPSGVDPEYLNSLIGQGIGSPLPDQPDPVVLLALRDLLSHRMNSLLRRPRPFVFDWRRCRDRSPG